ncbi:hypothetical protein J2S78_000258 [Salibacterium salarium]|nr:hypothetical protein [Salibacterium salarium]MDQ0297850.1 hypothetical protein [Salibacterium salarium]
MKTEEETEEQGAGYFKKVIERKGNGVKSNKENDIEGELRK